jgi:hypothetical protein
VGLSEDKGASCGLAKGNGVSPDPFERQFALCLAGKAGGRAPFAWGAVSLVIGAAVRLAVLGASLGDACACTGFALGVGGHWSPLACPFVVEGHRLVVGSGSGTGVAPNVSSTSVAQSNDIDW